MIKREGKRLLKLITSLILSSICFNISYSQTTKIDSSAFRKDFEKLLSKYGLSGEHYLINVTSYNQAGGQTAFVINNNYYDGTVADSTNVAFKILNEGEAKILLVSPKNGSWVTPFVMTDSIRAQKPFYNPGAGLIKSISGISFTDTMENKTYNLVGAIPNGACSKSFPLRIFLSKTTPDEFFIFGDFDNINKTYWFHKGKVTWCPRPDIP